MPLPDRVRSGFPVVWAVAAGVESALVALAFFGRIDARVLVCAAAAVFGLALLYDLLRRSPPRKEEGLSVPALVSSLPEAVAVVDAGMRILAVNGGACRLLGLVPLHAAGTDLLALSDADGAERLQDTKEGTLEILIRGRRRRLTVVPVGGAGDRRIVVEEPEHGTRVEKIGSRQGPDQSQVLRDLWKAVSELGRDISKMDEEGRKRFSAALVRARKAINWFDEVDTLPAPRLEQLDLADLARQALERSMPLARAKGLRTQIRSQGETIVSADRELIRRAVDEIVFNACCYTNEGAVKIGVEGGAAEVAILCHDSGIGVSESELGRLFDLGFVGSNQLPETGGGRGIGLTLAKRVAETHGGSIRIESRVGRGTTITLKIPKARPIL